MYRPKHFDCTDAAMLGRITTAHPFAVLVTTLDGRLDATHLPVLADHARGAHGVLRFHLAAANPAARALDGTVEALVVFTGPNAYVSPDWYVTPEQVPTWNYAAVHAYGRPTPVSDPEAVLALLADLSAFAEGGLDKAPWTMDKVPDARMRAMLRGIVAFEMQVERIEGKAKLSQNRADADRAGAAAALSNEPGEGARAVAAMMRALDEGP